MLQIKKNSTRLTEGLYRTVQEKQTKIVGIIRALESAGEIIITRDTAEDEYIE